MPTKEEMLTAIQAEAKARKLSARAVGRLTGIQKDTARRVLKGDDKTRTTTVFFIYSKLILEQYSEATEKKESVA